MLRLETTVLANCCVELYARVKSGIRIMGCPPISRSRMLMIVYAASVSGALLFAAGCSGGGPTGATHATLLITATNNAKIPVFKLNLEGLTLVASDGKEVPALATPQMVELGSMSGVARPLVAMDIPRGTYTSVKLTYGPSTFVIVGLIGVPGYSYAIANYDISTPGGQPATVDLQLGTPLVVSGNAMGILLDLNIPQSTTFTPYSLTTPGVGGQTSFHPVCTVSAVPLAAQPSTLLDGKVEDLHGQVTANTGNVLTITSGTGASFNFTTSSATVLAGPNGTSAAPVGGFVDVDAALQSDGSMLATLVQTEATTQAYNMIGQVIQYTFQRYVQNMGREQQGPNLPNGTGFYSNNVEFNSTPQFEIAWPGGAAPSGLPFTPTLDAASLVPGQNVDTPSDFLQTVGNIIPPTKVVTLEPQTINATITGVSSANGQTAYQATLFADDAIAMFGAGQSVVVDVTAETHMIATSAPTTGSVARFRGLLFNDGGTLRMVATEIEDGVADF